MPVSVGLSVGNFQFLENKITWSPHEMNFWSPTWENSRFINPRKICFFNGNYLIIHYSNGNFLPWLIVFLLILISCLKSFPVRRGKEGAQGYSVFRVGWWKMTFLNSLFINAFFNISTSKRDRHYASRFMCFYDNKCLGAIFLLLFSLLMLFLLQQGKS